jgi:hypothetical protein
MPDFFQAGGGPQIVNMPVRPRRRLTVVRHAGAHAPWTERTADVDVEARADLNLPEAPDPHRATGGG